MKKKFASIGAAIGILLGIAIIVYAVSSLFFTQSETSGLTKKTIFQFDLTTNMEDTQVAPGESFTVAPTIYNDATEAMYVFIVIEQPTYNDEDLYDYTVGSGWQLVSSFDGKQVYAYADGEMISLQPGDTTEALTEQMTMKEITNAEYSQIDDINVVITGYATGTEDTSSNPAEAWTECRAAGNID